MSTIYTSTPRAMLLGVRDDSIREIPLEDIVLPSHLPWAMTFAEQGDGFPHMLMGAGAVRTYGAETFDITGKYATHQTAAINVFMQNANPIMLQRIIPDEAKTAMLRLSVEIIPTMIPDYVRNPDGSLVYEFNEFDERVPEVKEMIPGHRLVFHTTVEPWGIGEVVNPEQLAFGGGVKITSFRNGDFQSETGEALGELDGSIYDGTPRSDLYPIMDVLVSSAGSFGNRRGIRLMLPTSKGSSPLDMNTFYESQAYLPRMGIVSVDPKDGKYTNIPTTGGDLFLDVSFKEGVRTERGKVPLYIGDRLVEEYQIANNPAQPFIPGPYSKVHVYHDDLKELYERLITGSGPISGIRGEAAFNDAAREHRAYDLSVTNADMLNFLGGYDEGGAPYYSFETKKSAIFGGASLGNETYMFPTGGDDGLPLTLTGAVDELEKYAIFDNAVRREAENFGKGDVKWLNTAKYPINAVWDTGFSIDTKKALLTPIGLRKDIAVVLATHSVGDFVTVPDTSGVTIPGQPSIPNRFIKKYQWVGDNDMATETAVAGMLRTHASLFPESEVHGTPVCRAIIVGQSARLIGSPYTRRLPLTIEYANKVSRFMGAADGFWNPTRAYDQKGQNIIELMRDVNLTWREENVANQQWANGLVYAEDYDMRRMFFPAIRTVYNNETSVLNSSITMWAITNIEREAHNSWRDLVGNAKFSPAKFLQESDRILTERLAKRFDDRFIIEVETFYTANDVLRGYSWSCNIHIYAPNMKTVGQYTVVAHRIEDYQADIAA